MNSDLEVGARGAARALGFALLGPGLELEAVRLLYVHEFGFESRGIRRDHLDERAPLALERVASCPATHRRDLPLWSARVAQVCRAA